MRGKRAKQYRKLMHQYQLHFGFREPYQVLVDAQMVQDAKRFSMDLVQGLERTLQGKVKPMITQCSMRHLYESEPKDNAAIDQAKSYERRRCNHHTLEKPLSTLECLCEVVDPKSSKTNKHRYVVASQDPKVRACMRQIPGVPMIYINRSVMIMEPMAEVTEEAREREEKGKFRAGLKPKRQASGAHKRKREDEDEDADADEGINDAVPEDDAAQRAEAQPAPAKKKRKGPKGPNPLSVKKPKKRLEEQLVAKSTKKPVPDADAASAAEAGAEAGAGAGAGAPTDGDQQEPSKRKRKRKHKAHGDGHGEGDSAQSAAEPSEET